MYQTNSILHYSFLTISTQERPFFLLNKSSKIWYFTVHNYKDFLTI